MIMRLLLHQLPTTVWTPRRDVTGLGLAAQEPMGTKAQKRASAALLHIVDRPQDSGLANLVYVVSPRVYHIAADAYHSLSQALSSVFSVSATGRKRGTWMRNLVALDALTRLLSFTTNGCVEVQFSSIFARAHSFISSQV
jgi:hypothetical protein